MRIASRRNFGAWQIFGAIFYEGTGRTFILLDSWQSPRSGASAWIGCRGLGLKIAGAWVRCLSLRFDDADFPGASKREMILSSSFSYCNCVGV